MLLLLILFASTAAFVSACTSRAPATVAVAPQEVFTVSFASGSRDVTGRFMGGTEMRVLAAHGGKLYAGRQWVLGGPAGARRASGCPGPDARQPGRALGGDCWLPQATEATSRVQCKPPGLGGASGRMMLE